MSEQLSVSDSSLPRIAGERLREDRKVAETLLPPYPDTFGKGSEGPLSDAPAALTDDVPTAENEPHFSKKLICKAPGGSGQSPEEKTTCVPLSGTA